MLVLILFCYCCWFLILVRIVSAWVHIVLIFQVVVDCICVVAYILCWSCCYLFLCYCICCCRLVILLSMLLSYWFVLLLCLLRVVSIPWSGLFSQLIQAIIVFLDNFVLWVHQSIRYFYQICAFSLTTFYKLFYSRLFPLLTNYSYLTLNFFISAASSSRWQISTCSIYPNLPKINDISVISRYIYSCRHCICWVMWMEQFWRLVSYADVMDDLMDGMDECGDEVVWRW